MADSSKPAARGPGRPFQPGQSGNPGGRLSLPAEFKAKGPALVAAMTKLAEDEEHEHHFDALKWCVEKIYGKAAQQLEVETSDTLGSVLAATIASRGKPQE